MADKRITDVDYVDSLDSNESFFVNKNNAIKQINKSDIVFGISNGGTGAVTADEARVNLGATNEAYVNAQIKAAKDYAVLVADEKVEAAKAKPSIITLVSDGWVDNKQTISIENVTENSIVFISPNVTSHASYCESNTRCITQEYGSLTFQCEYIPSVNLVVNVVIM